MTDDRSRAAIEAALGGRVDEDVARGDEGDGGGGVAPYVGYGMAGVGVVGLGLAWAFWLDLEAKNDDFAAADPTADGYGATQRAVDEAERPLLVAGLAGGTLLTASMPFWLPEADGVPWWSWVAGGAGAAVGALGAISLAGEGECLDQACLRRAQDDVFGALLLSHAAPLLAVPITYLVRALGADEASSATVAFTPSEARISLQGRF